jgi:hypothetical protein
MTEKGFFVGGVESPTILLSQSPPRPKGPLRAFQRKREASGCGEAPGTGLQKGKRPDPSPRLASGHPNLLHADDDPDNQVTVRLALKDVEGLTVEQANDEAGSA